MKTNLILLCLMMLLFSCAKGVKTKAVFSLRSLSNLSTEVQSISQNGLVIFGTNDRGHRFSKVVVDTSGNINDFDHELDNGIWTFKAISWEDPSANLGGTGVTEKFAGAPNCAVAILPLNGSEQTINLSLSNANCELDAFGGVSKSGDSGDFTGKVFNPLKDIITCNEKVDLTTGVTTATACKYDLAAHISGNTGFVDRGYYASYEIAAKSFYAGPNNTIIGDTELVSTCLEAGGANTITSGGLNTLSDYQIPSGAGLEFVVRGYYEPGCTGRFKPHILGAGLETNNINITSANDDTVASEKQILFLKSNTQEVCNSNLTNPASLFAGGSGTAFNPYLICTPRHLNEIYGTGTPTHMANSFRLMSNLDMNLETIAIYGSGTFHGEHSHDLDGGRNFKPIGFNESQTGVASCVSALPVAYSGNFDGQNFSIDNLRIGAYRVSTGECGSTGMFAQLNNANIARLIFSNVELEDATTNAGIIAGQSTGGNIYEVNIKNARVSAENSNGYIGGLVGNISTGTQVKKVNIKNIQIQVRKEGAGNLTSGVGGIAGAINNGASLSDIVVRGSVQADWNGAGGPNYAQNIGGVVGTVLGTGQINNSAFFGVVRGDQIVGGIAGSAGGAGTAANFFVDGQIVSRPVGGTCNPRVGGIFGESGKALSNAFFGGRLTYQDPGCAAPAMNNYGAIVGSQPTGGVTNSYTLAPYSAPNGMPEGGTAPTTNYDDTEWRDSTWISGLGLDTTNIWSHIDGDIPRLKIDNQSPCSETDNFATVASQVASFGRGTSNNPIILCSRSQFDEIGSYPASSYKLEESITVMPSSGGFTTFSGVMNGQRNSIFGLSDILFTTNTGTIKNINFIGVGITPGGDNVGLIATNSGLIENLAVNGYVSGDNTIGMLAATNAGLIKNVFVDGSVNGLKENIGMLTGINQGQIIGAEVSGYMTIASDYSANTLVNIGGVAGLNDTGALIDKVEAHNRLELFAGSGDLDDEYLGGIAGDNNGTITNFIVPQFEIEEKTTPAMLQARIGLVAGTQTGGTSQFGQLYFRSGTPTELYGDDTSFASVSNMDQFYFIDDTTTPMVYDTTPDNASEFATLVEFQSSGWNMQSYDDGAGGINPIFLNYFIAKLTGQTPPSNVPTWEFNSGADVDEIIRLFND